jgi:hypothetical protein
MHNHFIQWTGGLFMSSLIDIIDGVTYIPGVNAVVMETSSREMFEYILSPITIGQFKIAPWGEDNQLPQAVTKNVESSEVLSSGMLFNTSVLYGQGVKPMVKNIKEGKLIGLNECEYDEVNQFFEDNDVAGFFLEQCTDMAWFHNVIPEVILSNDLKQIVSLRSKEASYSRWGVIPKGANRILKHYYSAKWDYSPNEQDLIESDVLDSYNPFLDITERIRKRSFKEPRFMLNINFPSPGKVYYQRAPWWSVFNSGWFDYSQMIPEFKKALLRNGLKIQYIIYVSKKYWDIIFREEKIDINNVEDVKRRKAEEFDKFKKFLAQEKNAGKGIMLAKEMIQTSSTAIEEKYVTIDVIKSEIKGGEFVEDSEEVSNMMSYAMGVHPSLIGSSPGKNNGSMSGTDKRELFMIKSAMMKPYRDRQLRTLNFIKRFNNWPNDLVFVVPEMDFTTLDQNKSGKQEKTPANVNQ